MGKLKNYWDSFWRIKNIEYYFLALVLLLGFVVRLYRIDYPIADWHSWRQADTASVSRIFVDEGINLLYPKYYDISTAQSGIFNPEGYRFVEFPIYNAIHAVLALNFPVFSLEVWGRLVSILFASLSTYLLFLFGRKYIGIAGGVLAAFFYAFLPFNIYFTRVILPEPAAVFFALFSLWHFVIYLEKPSFLRLVISAFAFSFALLVKPYIVFYAFPMLVLAVNKMGIKSVLKNKSMWMAAGIAIIPFLLWRWWENHFPEGIPFWTWAFNGDGIRFKPSYWRWIFGERLGNMLLGGWGLVPFTFGVLAIKKWKEFTALMLFSVLLYVVVVASANVKHDYYQTLVVPAVALTLARGSVFLWSSKHFNKKILRFLLVFSLLLMFLTTVERHKFSFNVNHWEIVKAGQAVDRLVEKDALVIAPYNGDTAFLYQTKRRGWPVVDRSLDQLIEKGAKYFVSVNFDDLTNKVIQEYEVVEKTDEYVIIKLQ
jgi:4-amino-4-deoxy-L-arabinose transferase-like glycosyltransferase